jgi:peptidoglycan-associated lipoprotein
MFTRGRIGSVVALLVLIVVMVSCAKRPATTAASAPAPTGVAGATGSSGGSGGSGSSGGSGAISMQPGGSGTATPTPSGSTSGGARPAPRDFAAIADLKDIFFDFDKYDIRPTDAKMLDANAAWLKSHENMLVLVEGHCDERGTNEYNLALGERRAKATMNYLVAQGVQANRITIISYGEERPVCSEHTEACWAKNRRAHFLIKPR